MTTLEYGADYEFPLDGEQHELFRDRMQYGKRVIAVSSFVLEHGEEVAVPIKNYPMLWMSEYCSEQMGTVVSSKDVQEAGFPKLPYLKDELTPIQRTFKKLTEAGLPIARTGGRKDCRYHLPRLHTSYVRYVEDPEIVATLDQRYRLPSQIRHARAMLALDDFLLPRLRIKNPRTSWRRFGACAGTDRDLFFSDDPEDTRIAIGICNTCPVKKQCHEFATEHGEVGVWGGDKFN